MASVLLDTTVLIDLLRGRPAAVERVRGLADAGDVVWTSPVNVEEIARGVRPSETVLARRLLAGLRLAPLGEDEAWRAGEWRREFAARGTTLSQADCLIAAATLSIGARLATGNPRHFPMSDIAVEDWPPG